MNLLQALILGVVQGLTEFLPISSSGHLVLVPWLLGWQIDPDVVFPFDVLVQWGTLMAVIAYFRGDLMDLLAAVVRSLLRGRLFETPSSRLAWLIALASLPAVIAGLLIKDLVASAFDAPKAVSIFLLATAALLYIGERLGRRAHDLSKLSPADALWIGIAQVFSLFPGVSRSGATIAGGMTRGLHRRAAARFSFLMAVPVMIGAGIIALIDLLSTAPLSAHLAPLAVGFLASAIVGYVAIAWLLSYLTRRPLTIFIAYCLIVGSGGLLLSVLCG